MCLPFPTRSTIAQRSSSLNALHCQLGEFSTTQSTAQQNRQYGSIAFPGERLPVGELPKSGRFTRRQPVAQTRSKFANSLPRWMPAASSGLRRPQSAASYASRLAAMRTLMVPGARPRSWRLILYRRTTVLLKASRGSEQYQATNSSMACWYPRLESGEPRLRRTAALDISRSGIPSLVFGRFFFPLELAFGFCFMGRARQSPRQARSECDLDKVKLSLVRRVGTSSICRSRGCRSDSFVFRQFSPGRFRQADISVLICSSKR
jgi:hypothetical protein